MRFILLNLESALTALGFGATARVSRPCFRWEAERTPETGCRRGWGRSGSDVRSVVTKCGRKVCSRARSALPRTHSRPGPVRCKTVERPSHGARVDGAAIRRNLGIFARAKSVVPCRFAQVYLLRFRNHAGDRAHRRADDNAGWSAHNANSSADASPGKASVAYCGATTGQSNCCQQNYPARSQIFVSFHAKCSGIGRCCSRKITFTCVRFPRSIPAAIS